jgi:hypothetical protein
MLEGFAEVKAKLHANTTASTGPIESPAERAAEIILDMKGLGSPCAPARP